VLGHGDGRRWLWTVAIAALPLGIVVLGFHAWRRICPLAFFASIPGRLGRAGTRKAGPFLQRWGLAVQAGLLVAALVLRLVLINGSAPALAAVLVGLALTAAVVGAAYRGKTWCNYLCPVGTIEKLYTEPVRLFGAANSQCASCSACKPRCPDIDVEQAYWKDPDSRARRLVYYAFPGVVAAFYGHYFLHAGDWDWYFSGDWTRVMPAPATVPVLVSAPLALLVGGGLSFGLFESCRRAASARGGAEAVVLHRSLALAGFVAFNIFYAFAGAPTLLTFPPWVQRACAFAVVLASTLVLVRRWGRDQDTFVQERFAKRLARKWRWDDAIEGRSAAELVTLHGERARARKERLDAYAETVKELAAEGVLGRAGLVLLASIRGRLGISDSEHDKIIAKLESRTRDLFDERAREAALQREQYGRELAGIVEVADAPTLERLRRRYGVDQAAHEAAVTALLDPAGALAERIGGHEARLSALASTAAAADGPSPEHDFLAYACDHAGRPVADALRAILATAGRPFEPPPPGPDPVDLSTVAEHDPDRWVRAAAARLAGAPVPELDPVLPLRRVDLLAGLPPGDLARVADVARRRTLDGGQVLCAQGDPGDDVYLLLSGSFVVERDGVEVERPGPGAYIGELAVLSPAPRAASVRAASACDVLVLPGPAFRGLLGDHPPVAAGVLAALAARLQR